MNTLSHFKWLRNRFDFYFWHYLCIYKLAYCCKFIWIGSFISYSSRADIAYLHLLNNFLNILVLASNAKWEIAKENLYSYIETKTSFTNVMQNEPRNLGDKLKLWSKHLKAKFTLASMFCMIISKILFNFPFPQKPKESRYIRHLHKNFFENFRPLIVQPKSVESFQAIFV